MTKGLLNRTLVGVTGVLLRRAVGPEGQTECELFIFHKLFPVLAFANEALFVDPGRGLEVEL